MGQMRQWLDQIVVARAKPELSIDCLRLRDAIASSVEFRTAVAFTTDEVISDAQSNEALHVALDRPEVKAVTVSWVQFASGYRTDLARLGRACRERGVMLLVDARMQQSRLSM